MPVCLPQSHRTFSYKTSETSSYTRISHSPILPTRVSVHNAVIETDKPKETEMNAQQLHEEIKEANLSYMMLAKQMINDDKASAIFRLGISDEMADLLAGLTPAQLLKMAASNMLLCAFRFDERLLLNMVTDYNKDRMMSQAHATILMSARPVEQLAA